jgi:carboxylesterase type B
MSGASINKMAGKEPESVLNGWLKGAKLIGCTDAENVSENRFTPKIIECLQNADTEKLGSIWALPEMSEGKIGFMSQVIVDGNFLPEMPLNMLKNGDYKKNVNLLIGTVEDEGSFALGMIVDPVKYSHTTPHNLTYNEAYNELRRLSSNLVSKQPVNGNDVAKLYFTGLSVNNDYDLLRRTIGIAIGDFALGCPTIQFAKTLYSNDRHNSNVYQYYYTSKLGKEKLYCAKWMGACHADDIWPAFGIPFREFDIHLDREREISAQFIDFFSHFARTGFV